MFIFSESKFVLITFSNINTTTRNIYCENKTFISYIKKEVLLFDKTNEMEINDENKRVIILV